MLVGNCIVYGQCNIALVTVSSNLCYDSHRPECPVGTDCVLITYLSLHFQIHKINIRNYKYILIDNCIENVNAVLKYMCILNKYKILM